MMTEKGRVIELLLSGQFICQSTDEDAWEHLQQADNLQAVNDHLAVLNRVVASAAEDTVYYGSYIELGEKERRVLASQFQETSSNLMPLVEWLVLVQEAMGTDLPLTQGTHIRLNELQMTLEDTPAFSEQLQKISRYSLFGSKATELDAQLKLVFRRLVDLGYLLRPNPEKQIYLATGKVDYLFEVIKFIDETESLSLAERAEDAMSQIHLI